MHVPDFASKIMPHGAQLAFTFITGVPMVIVGLIALGLLIRDRDPLLLFCFIGGGLASFFEPVADILCHLYFPVVGQHTAYTTFGRPIPWALVFAYPWYVGGQGYLAGLLFRRGITKRGIWLMWAAFVLSDIACETPGVLTGFHVYYGHQPFEYWKFPLWMAATQSLMPMIAGALVFVVSRQIGSGWRLAVVIPLIPMADGMGNAGVDLPLWSTLSNNLSLGVNYIAAVATIAMAAIVVWIFTIVLGQDRPPGHERRRAEVSELREDPVALDAA
jgi:hypothetical protein